jgi:hypothetical protein
MRITKSQTKLNAIRSERSNFHLRNIYIAAPQQVHQLTRPHHTHRSREPSYFTRQLAFFCLSRFDLTQSESASAYGTLLPADMPITKKIRQISRNRKNNNLAIPAAAAAIPVNPKSAATSAIIRKIKAQRSILFTSSKSNRASGLWRVFLA